MLTLQQLAGNRAVAQRVQHPIQRADPPTPPAPPTAPAQGAEKIGYIYTLRGQVQGKPVVYSGSTAREVAERLYRDKHKWAELIRDKSTTIEVHEITATLNVAEAGSLQAARNQALRAAEQVVIKRRRAEPGGAEAEVNVDEAAQEGNIELWAERHQVRLGARSTFRAGVKVFGFAAFQLLDFFLMYRDAKLSQYAWAPYLLEDEQGIFTLQETDRGIFRSNWYWKVYKAGPMAGQRVQVTKEEFRGLQQEAELLWGTTDWMGDFVPGLLRRELPVVEDQPHWEA